ncbi:MAG: amino acid kinase family protein, partial [Chthoniobacterales bacterium]
MNQPWVVHKFGGTSLADAERYRQVVTILRSENGARKAIVVSAMSKVTDALLEVVQLATSQRDEYLGGIEALRARHLQTIDQLLPADARGPIVAAIESDFKDIKEILRGVYLSRGSSNGTLDFIAGHGELWSAQLLNAYLNSEGISASYLDARKVLTVEPDDGVVRVDWKRSQTQMANWLDGLTSDWIVITGFVASTPDGIPTTLRRNGSDFSASIFGRLLAANAITIWTDVNGVLSADPRLVPDAVVLGEVSYQE